CAVVPRQCPPGRTASAALAAQLARETTSAHVEDRDGGGLDRDPGFRRRNCSARTERLPQGILERAVDQDESDPANLVRAVCPGMVGAALDDNVACPAENLAIVHNQVNLTGQYDAVVNCFGAVHEGMCRALMARRSLPGIDQLEVPARF